MEGRLDHPHTISVPDRPPAGLAEPVRLRAVGLGLLLAILICAVTPFNNAYRQATPLGGGHFPLAPFYLLLWLTIFTAAARRCLRRLVWLTGQELLVVWMLTVLVSGIAYTGLVRTFFLNVTAPFHFATVENRWQAILHPYLPKILYLDRKSVV